MCQSEKRRVCDDGSNNFPQETKSLMLQLQQDFKKLKKRHRHAIVKNERIANLSRPKWTTPNFVPKTSTLLRKPIEIIQVDQTPIYTRTEQLAYPPARKLLLFKNQIRKQFEPERIIRLNRLIRKSIFSIYSRLENVQPPKKIKIIHKWNQLQWARHTRRNRKLATPKKVPEPPKMPNPRKPYDEMRRYKKLAIPKINDITPQYEWKLTPDLKTFKPSDRLIKLANARTYDISAFHQDLPIEIPESALNAKASRRIQALSEPSGRRTNKSIHADIKEDPMAISPNALKAKASKRIEELAEPREYQNIHIRDDPFAISKSALTAKAKPRTIKLAEPIKR